MSSEAVSDYLAFAQHKLSNAERIHGIGIHEVAAREAYLAALNAARAVILDKTGKITKTHRGVRALLWELIRGGLAFDPKLAEFLTSGFEIKVSVDYVDAGNMTGTAAAEILSTARAFVDAARSACTPLQP